jgi:N-acetylneuraminic acid mutarotase
MIAGCANDDRSTADVTSAPTTATSSGDPEVTLSWSPAPAMLQPRSAHGVVVADGVLYAAGGTGKDRRPVLQVEGFDGAAWTEVTTLPGDGVNAPSVAALGGRIYVIGGFTGTSSRPTSDVHVFDIATSTWSAAAPLPTASGGHAAVALDDRIHVIGGGTSRSTIADHVVYDPTTDSWSNAAPLPVPKGSPSAVVLDGQLWAIGGRSGPDDFGDVDVYDAATDTWSPGPSIDPRGTAGAVVVCGMIVLIGGESQAANTVLSDVLLLADGTWTPAQSMPTARSFARTVVLDDTIYVVGGSTNYGQSHASAGSGVVEQAATTC